jgi:hypothetical protein
MILAYEVGDPVETARENVVLAEHGFSSGGIIPEAIATRPDGTDPIDLDGAARMVRGFSLAGASGSLIGASGGDVVLDMEMTAHPYIKGL